MKRAIAILISVIFIFTFTGCNSNNKRNPDDIPYDVQEFDWTVPYEYFEGQEEYKIMGGNTPFEDYFKYSETTLFGYDADIVYHYGNGSKQLHNILYALVLPDVDEDVSTICKVIDNQFNTQTSTQRYPTWIDSENNLEITFIYNETEGKISMLFFSQITEETDS